MHQPVQQNLAVLFRVLDGYFRLKSMVLEPVIEADSETRRIALAQHSGRVVVALNTAKETLFNRVDATHAGDRISHCLRLYFIAQDIHERASSSHYPYDDLIDAFFHSDVLFRCQRLMRLRGRACGQLARAILLRVPFDKSDDSTQAVRDLRSSLDHLQRQQKPQWLDLLGSLGALAHNLERWTLNFPTPAIPMPISVATMACCSTVRPAPGAMPLAVCASNCRSAWHGMHAAGTGGGLDAVEYRLARRNAYDADAALPTVLANMGQEPGRARHERDSGLQFLVRPHTMLKYISGLGAHRQLLDRATGHGPRQADSPRTTDHHAFDAMARGQISADFLSDMPPDATADAPGEALSGTHRLVHDQLRLLSAQLGPLRDAVATLAA